jgi:hypothetical protein
MLPNYGQESRRSTVRNKCEPLYPGDLGFKGKGFCGKVFDDAEQWTFCPHDPLPTEEEKADAAKLIERFLAEGGVNAL